MKTYLDENVHDNDEAFSEQNDSYNEDITDEE